MSACDLRCPLSCICSLRPTSTPCPLGLCSAVSSPNSLTALHASQVLKLTTRCAHARTRIAAARDDDEGSYAQCFQGKLILECHDDAPAAQDGWFGGKWRDPDTGKNCSEYEGNGWCRGRVASVLGPLHRPPDVAAGGRPQLIPVDDRFKAERVCCACGGGRTKAIYTQIKCVQVEVRADEAPELQVAAQVEGREEPCGSFRLGDPPKIEQRCITPVVRGPCAPPFDCKVLTADGSASYPRRLTKTVPLGAISHVKIRNGGSSCAQSGMLSAVPVGGFGAGFVGRFEIAEKGSFRGTSGAMTKVNTPVVRG